MDHPINNAYIMSFLNEQKLAVLSTVNEQGLPDAAPIYYSSDYLFNIYFVTPESTRKHLNMIRQPNVVLTITDEASATTVHIRGTAAILDNRLEKTFGELAQKLQFKNGLIESLPVLKHTKTPHRVVEVSPIEVRIRQYAEGALIEKLAELND